MKKFSLVFLAILTGLVLTWPSYAMEGMSQKHESKMGTCDTVASNQLINMRVFDQKGYEIGRIKDVKVNTASEKIDYVVLQKLSLLGKSNESVLVPTQALQISLRENIATLTVATDKLKGAPIQQANMSDEAFQREIEKYYGVAPEWPFGENKTQQAVRHNYMKEKF
jgi:sporulation protein YlmC with PRC-barrel domain